jgi:hypothetical protein
MKFKQEASCERRPCALAAPKLGETCSSDHGVFASQEADRKGAILCLLFLEKVKAPGFASAMKQSESRKR